MKINSKIFKAYDIRGIYPKEVSEQTAYLIGRAFVQFLKKKNPKIVVGRDNRSSSGSLADNLIKGLVEQGAQVTNIGLSTTPMLYWAASKFDGGINITASHNPSQYNGFKIVKEGTVPVGGDTGLKEIERLTQKLKDSPDKGKVVLKDILPDYLRFNLKGTDLKKIKDLKIVVDTANAVAGVVIPKFFEKLPCRVSYLFLDLDGRFPNHEPDPLVKSNLKWLQNKVKQEKADLGIAFDGDGDRIRFVDEKGEPVAGDLITALLSNIILKKKPKEKIIYDIRSSNIVPETIKKAGGRPMVSKIGHSFIKKEMRRHNIIFAGELSGHYYRKDHYFSEAPLFVLLEIIKAISEGGKMSDIISPFQKYFQSEEINLDIKDKEGAIARLEKKFKTGKVSKLDGLRVDFDDWWFLARPSNTEPVLRLSLEAKTKELLAEKTHLLSNLLNG